LICWMFAVASVKERVSLSVFGRKKIPIIGMKRKQF
jgi:hypothetical protein